MFVNSVQTVTQKQYWVKNWVKNRLGAPSAQPAGPASTPRCTPAHPGARVHGCVAGLHGRIAGAPALYRGHVRAQAWPYRGLPHDTMPSRLAPLVTIHPIVLQYNPQLLAPAGHNTIHFIAIQYPLLQPLLVIIQSVYCDPIPLPKLLYCNTMPAHCNTIFFSSQPAISCNTLPLLQYNFIGQ